MQFKKNSTPRLHFMSKYSGNASATFEVVRRGDFVILVSLILVILVSLVSLWQSCVFEAVLGSIIRIPAIHVVGKGGGGRILLHVVEVLF